MNNWNDPNCRQYPIIPCLENEIWKVLTDREAKDIKPYYMISNLGRVFNIYSGKFMKMCIDTKGYWYYNLRSYNAHQGARAYRVHRLIMLAFHYEEGCEDMEIDHIDADKTNFFENNLRWCTHSENGMYSYQNGHKNAKGEERVQAKITDAQAEIICQRIADGENMRQIAKDMNIDENIVYSISNHRAWNHISCKYDFNRKNISSWRAREK